MTAPELGGRPSLLLGMLIGKPQTAAELRRTIAAASADPDLMEAMAEGFDGCVLTAFVALADAGEPEILVTLDRLVELHMVEALADPDGGTMYAAKPVKDWPA